MTNKFLSESLFCQLRSPSMVTLSYHSSVAYGNSSCSSRWKYWTNFNSTAGANTWAQKQKTQMSNSSLRKANSADGSGADANNRRPPTTCGSLTFQKQTDRLTHYGPGPM